VDAEQMQMQYQKPVERNMRQTKKHDIGRYKILFGRGIVKSVSILSSEIQQNTFDRFRRQFV